MELKPMEQIKHEEYPIMWKRERIGTLIEDKEEKGYFVVYMVLDQSKEDKWPMVLRVRQQAGIVDWANTIQFVENRVTPKDQDGIEEKLIEMKMQQYDAYSIFRDGNGLSAGDFLWVLFRGDITFDNSHPRAHVVV